VPAKVTKLIGFKRPPFLSPTNLIIFAGTQNGEYEIFYSGIHFLWSILNEFLFLIH
jgi:hypothetical protein